MVADPNTVIGWLADELQRDSCMDEEEARHWAAGLLVGYRLGDPAAFRGMTEAGEENCRLLVREALEVERIEFDGAAVVA